MKIAKYNNKIEVLIAGEHKYALYGDDYKERQLWQLNDRVNGGYYKWKENSYLIDGDNVLVGNTFEIRRAALKRAYRFRALVNAGLRQYNYMDSLRVKTSVAGFKQWCKVEKHYINNYAYYRIISKRGNHIDYGLKDINRVSKENGDFITKIKVGN